MLNSVLPGQGDLFLLLWLESRLHVLPWIIWVTSFFNSESGKDEA